MMHRYAAMAGLARRIIVPVPVLTPTLSVALGRADHAGALDDRQAAGRLAAQRGRRQGARHRGATCPTRPRGCSASTGPSSWRCSASRTPRWSPGGRPRRCPARRATRCRPTPTGPAARSTRTSGAARCRPPPRRCGGSSRASAATAAGTPSRSPGGSAAWPTGWSAASGCAAAAATPSGSTSARRIDFWRVEERDEGRLLRLRAEMRLPGLAWLELGIEDRADGSPPRCRRGLLDDVRPAGGLPPPRPARAPVLVGGGALPRGGLRRDGPQHRPRPPSSSSGASRSPPPRPDASARRASRRRPGRRTPRRGRPSPQRPAHLGVEQVGCLLPRRDRVGPLVEVRHRRHQGADVDVPGDLVAGLAVGLPVAAAS